MSQNHLQFWMPVKNSGEDQIQHMYAGIDMPAITIAAEHRHYIRREAFVIAQLGYTFWGVRRDADKGGFPTLPPWPKGLHIGGH